MGKAATAWVLTGGAWKRRGGADRPSSATPPPTTTTWHGYNTNETDSPLSERQGWWSNRAPVVRRYTGGYIGASFPITTTIAPEKRVSFSFKADASGSFTRAGLAAGNGNARLTAWCESIPAGWTVWLTYFHEVNDDIRDFNNPDPNAPPGISHTDFVNAYAQFYPAIQAATLQAGVTVKLCANFMAYQLASTGTGPTDYDAMFNDAWVPAHGTMDLLTFDIYGNPGHFTTQVTGIGYGTSYPNVVTRCKDMFAAIERNGFASKWGILEYNTPARDWDTDESARATWHRQFIDHCMAPPMTGAVPPQIFLAWEAPSGVNWDQSYGRVSGNPLTVANVVKPYILGTPVGV